MAGWVWRRRWGQEGRTEREEPYDTLLAHNYHRPVAAPGQVLKQVDSQKSDLLHWSLLVRDGLEVLLIVHSVQSP